MSLRHLVTGAAGLVGHAYLRRCLELGGSAVALDDGRKGGMEDLAALAARHRGRVEIVQADLSRAPLPDPGRFDVVAHFAAVLGVRHVSEHPWQTIAENLRGTLAALEAAGASGARACLFASSSEAYAFGIAHGWVPLPTPEDVPLGIPDPILPRWSYAASKLAGESAVFSAAREFGFAPLVVRFHNVYGPRMPATHVIPDLLQRCLRREDPLVVLGPEQTRSFLHVDDAARALELVVRAGLERGGGIWNVGSADEVVIGDLAALCLRTSAHAARIEARPAPPGSVARRVPDVTRLAALGFAPRITLAEGVESCWRALIAATRRG